MQAIQNIETDENGVATFRLKSEDKPDIQFRGRLLGSISTRKKGWRWTEAFAFQTEGGKWIVQVVSMSTVPDEVPRATVHVFGSSAEMTRELSHLRFCLKLWEQIGLDVVEIE